MLKATTICLGCSLLAFLAGQQHGIEIYRAKITATPDITEDDHNRKSYIWLTADRTYCRKLVIWEDAQCRNLNPTLTTYLPNK